MSAQDTPIVDDDSLDAAVLGLGLPPVLEQALHTAAASGGDADSVAAALARAEALVPGHPAVLIALYRHHFYGHRLAAAREVACRALPQAATALGLPADWRAVPARPLAGAWHDVMPRFYLFLLKGYAYLSLRLGEEREARDALALLRALDPQDCVGGSVVEAVRRRGLEVDDDAEPMPYVQRTGAAAWAALG